MENLERPVSLLRAGRLKKALDCIESLRIETAPKEQADLLCLFGDVKAELGDIDGASKAYSLAAGRAGALSDRGLKIRALVSRMALERDAGRFIAAVETGEEAQKHCDDIDLDTESSLIVQRALLSSDRGEMTQAAVDLRRLIDRAVSSGEKAVVRTAGLTLGFLLARCGERGRALALVNGLDRSVDDDCLSGIDDVLLEAAVRRMVFQVEDAEKILKSALSLVGREGERRYEARILRELGDMDYRRGEFSTARDLFRRALSLEKRIGRRINTAQLHWRLGNISRAQGALSRAEKLYVQALSTFSDLSHPTGMGRCLLALAGLAHSRGDDDSALDLLDECLLLRRDNGDHRGVAQVLGEQATVFRDLGDYGKAVDLYNHSLEMRRMFGDSYGEAVILNDMAMIYRFRGEYDRALALYEESMETKRAIGDRFGLALGYNDLALAMKDRGEFNQAFEAIDKGLALAEEIRARLLFVRLQTNKAHMLAFFGDADQALALLKGNMGRIKRIGCRAEEPKTLGIMAEIHRMRRRLSRAAHLLERCEHLAVSRGDRRQQAYILLQRAYLDADSGNHFGAIDSLIQCRKLREELGELRGIAEVSWREGFVHLALGNLSAADESFRRAGDLAESYSFPRPLLAADLGKAELALASGVAGGGSAARLEELLSRADDMEYIEGLCWAYRLLGFLHGDSGEPAIALRYLGRSLEMLDAGAWAGGRIWAEDILVSACNELVSKMKTELERLRLKDREPVSSRRKGDGVLVCLAYGLRDRFCPDSEGGSLRVSEATGRGIGIKNRVVSFIEADRIVVPKVLSNHGEIVLQLAGTVFAYFPDALSARRACRDIAVQMDLLDRLHPVDLRTGMVEGVSFDSDGMIGDIWLSAALAAAES